MSGLGMRGPNLKPPMLSLPRAVEVEAPETVHNLQASSKCSLCKSEPPTTCEIQALQSVANQSEPSAGAGGGAEHLGDVLQLRGYHEFRR